MCYSGTECRLACLLTHFTLFTVLSTFLFKQMIRFFPQKYGSTFSRPIANTELGGKDWKNWHYYCGCQVCEVEGGGNFSFVFFCFRNAIE